MVARINDLESSIQALSDAQLQGKTVDFRERIDKGESLESLLPEAFAVVREAGWRQMGMRHYDVQLVGGMVLHRGSIAEMKTGEGKTLVATLPMYLNALPSRGAHLITVNDYLASRDAEWMTKIYGWLGLTVGTITANISDTARKQAYGCDITYGTNNEFGFDYLRDNMKFRYEQYVHRYFDPPRESQNEKDRSKILNFAIVDEVDSVLIDEARTPLIISGSADESSDLYLRINAIIPFLRRDEDFLVDEKSHSVTLTDTGVDKVEQRLKIENLYDSENILIQHHVNQALKAHYIYKRDQNYMVRDGKVVIVDEFTGRPMEGRRWSDGLHQAVEAKEGVRVQEESHTLATITFQNYFRMYQKLSGMTGTAETEAEEFAKIYDLDCVVVPTNKPIARQDDEDVIYKNEKQKYTAIVDDILEKHAQKRPVLVGTVSVESSEKIAKVLSKRGIPHSVLNAKFHGAEAGIVSQAGREGAVTIATNMAGRGTDIMLGGNPELLAKHEIESEISTDFETRLAHHQTECADAKKRVLAAGGLHIIGTERHESRRIDNQLRGRAGRQGDPGSSRFFLSLDDDLLRVFGGDRIKGIMEMLKVPDDEPIEAKMVTKAVENAQRRVEGQNFDIRKNVLEYDDVMNMQRRTIYTLRRRVLEGSETPAMVRELIGDVSHEILDSHLPEGSTPDQWDTESLANELTHYFNKDVEIVETEDFDTIFQSVEKELSEYYSQREQTILSTIKAEHTGEDELSEEELNERAMDQWRFFEREQYLRSIDRLWKSHLVQMEHLRSGIHLNAYAQKDPKLMYKQQGYEIFQDLVSRISRETMRRLFHVVVKSEKEIEALRQRKETSVRESRGNSVSGSAGSSARQKQQTVKRDRPKLGRNDPCWCGSGKKYKKCHMAADEAARMQAGA